MKKFRVSTLLFAALTMLGIVALAHAVQAEDKGTQELAKESQNPVSDLISLPLQNNTNGGIGPTDALQNTTNIQPVWPINLNEDWNVITRTVLPVVYQEEIVPGTGSEFGLGDTTFTAFLSPSKVEDYTWGAGPVVLLPTSTDDRLGAGEWGLGLSGLVLYLPGKWVVGGLVSNVWSFEGNVNLMTLQPILNYNLSDGWYLTSVPIITANWEADSDQRWVVPIGGGVGKILKIGKQPVNMNLQIYYNLEAPDALGDWQGRFQFQFLFPKKPKSPA